LNSSKPIIVMIVLGVIIIATLSYIPYSLTLFPRMGLSSTPAVSTLPVSAENVPAPLTPPPPPFDAASWYISRAAEPEKHGALIETFDGRRVLTSHNADTGFNPASLLKLATSLVALRRLGANHRFETRVYTNGVTDASGALRGKIYVVGSDPLFGDVAASMIARELRARGVTKITDGIAVSPEFCFNYSDSPEESAKRLARVMRLSQKEQQVEVASTPPSGNPLFVLRSYPLREVLLYMNAHSNNFVADRLGAKVGGPEGVRRFLIEELKLPAEQVRIEWVSGRQRNEMTPRGILAVIRALYSEAERHGLKLEDIMPVVGRDYGTLRGRLAETPLHGAALAKTGTMTADVDGGTASLAGVVYTKDSGFVVFAICDQGSQIGENRQLEDQLLTEVITAHDIPVPISLVTPRQLLPQLSFQISDK